MFCKLFRSIIFSVVLLASPVAFADDICPRSIDVTQGIKTAPGGWTVGDSKLPADLTGITMFSGPPEEQASLVPDGRSEDDELNNDIWNLTPDTRGYWIQCNYANTTVTLAKKLPDNFKQCQVRYQKDVYIAGFRVPESVTCK
jgi:hypothetical protein